jgi:WD40 repeat protein
MIDGNNKDYGLDPASVRSQAKGRAAGGSGRRANAARLFGYDFFISFALGPAPRGTLSYSSDLARRLRERDFTVFFSEDEAPPGSALEASLLTALTKARILIVIVNHATLLEPRWVRKEVEEFRRRRPGRPIVPVSVGNALRDSVVLSVSQGWLPHSDAIWVDESEDAVAKGLVSEHVIDRLVMTPTSARANVRWRWVLRLVVAALASLTFGLGVAAWLANRNRIRADESAERAIAARRVAESRALGNAARLILATPRADWENEETGQCLAELAATLAVHGNRSAVTSESDAALRTAIQRLGAEDRAISIKLKTHALVSWGYASSGLIYTARTSEDHVVIERVDPATRRVEFLRSFSARDFNAKPIGLLFSRDAAWAGIMLVDGENTRKLSLIPTTASNPRPVDLGDAMAFASFSNSNEVVTLPQAFELRFWRLTSTDAAREAVALPGRPLGGLAVNSDGTLVAVGLQESSEKQLESVDRVLLLDTATRKRLLPTKFIQGSTVSALDFSPDRRWLAAGDLGSKITIWDVANGEAVASFALDDQVVSVMFSSNSRYLATAEQRGRVHIWDLESNRAVTQIESGMLMPTVAWASEQYLLVGGGSVSGSGRPGVYVALSNELEAVACQSMTSNPHPLDLRGRMPEGEAGIICAGKPVRPARCRHAHFY